MYQIFLFVQEITLHEVIDFEIVIRFGADHSCRAV